MRLLSTRLGCALPLVLAFLALLPQPSWSGDPDILWKIIHNDCVPDQSDHGKPEPCALVNLTDRFAVLKDHTGATQFLLIPTDRITGIEDPTILSTQAPNYWQAAWDARHFTSEQAGTPLSDDKIALAINSEHARSQNQLHIHIDCIRQEARETLRMLQLQQSADWTHATILAQDFDVRLLSVDDLKSKNLFKLASARLQPGQTMADESIVLAGAVLPDGSSGLYFLVGAGGAAFGEALEDHQCVIAKVP